MKSQVTCFYTWACKISKRVAVLTRLKGFSPLAPIEVFGLGNEWGILENFEHFEILEISDMLSNAKAVMLRPSNAKVKQC